MAALTLAVGGGGHPGEELRGLAVAKQVKEHRGGGTLAVVLVRGEGQVVAVGHRAFANIPAEEPRGLRDGVVEIGVLHPGFPRHHHADGQRQAGRIHRAVAIEIAAIRRETVAPGADTALAVRSFEGEPGQPRHDRRVAGGHHILRAEHHEVAVIPGEIAVRGELRRPLSLAFHQRQVVPVSAGQQRERVESPWDRVEPLRVGWLVGHALRQCRAAELEDAFRLLAVIRRGGAVAPEHRQFQIHDTCLSITPALQSQNARFSFRRRDRLRELHACVAREGCIAHAENHIAHFQDARCGRAVRDRGHENLPCVARVAVGGENPSAQSGRAERPVMRLVGLPSFREIRGRLGIAGGGASLRRDD